MSAANSPRRHLTMRERVLASVRRNPAAWFFAALLVLAIWGIYQTGAEFRAACADFLALQEGYSEPADPPRQFLRPEQVAAKLLAEANACLPDTRAGRECQWRNRLSERIERRCAAQAEPDPRDY
jgi:hypothetical protein